jgi:hypothetical protein
MEPNSPEYKEIIERPNQTKIDQGWAYGEKPSHKSFNWGWKKVDEFLHVVNSTGIPPWDKETLYVKGSVVTYNPYMYQALDANTNQNPLESPLHWKIIGKFLQDLLDTNISPPINDAEVHVLRYDSNVDLWKNVNITEVLATIRLEDLRDVYVDNNKLVEGYPLNYQRGYLGEYYGWVLNSMEDVALSSTSSDWTDVFDVSQATLTPSVGDICVYDGGIWKIKDNKAESEEWGNILNPFSEYPIPPSTEDVLGGGKFKQYDKTLYIYSTPSDKPGNPTDLKAFYGKSNQVELYWSPSYTGEVSAYFNVYRNNILLQSGVYDAYFVDTDVTANTEYTYFVRGYNWYGESPDSNSIIGHTFTVPNPPINLQYYIKGNTIELYWEKPELDQENTIFNIYRDSELIGDSSVKQFVDINVPNGSHSYFVTTKNKYYESTSSNTILVLVV